jgi:cytochrome c peroxidase
VYNRIAEHFEDDSNYDGSLCPKLWKPQSLTTPLDGSYAPVVLRLAWHSAGTYDKDTNTGGRLASIIDSWVYLELNIFCSNYATMRFEPESLHGANAGLGIAREFMGKVKQEFDWISYGDLWTLGGVAAIQVHTKILL